MNRLGLLPLPSRVELRNAVFALTPHTVIETSAACYAEADFLATRLRISTGLPAPVEADTGAGVETSSIALTIDEALSQDSPEAYRLAIGDDRIEITGASAHGVFNGVQTLLQLLPPAIFAATPQPGEKWEIRQGLIQDSPRFAWRGAMLDCVRHFRSVDFVKRSLDAMAMHRLNVLHWHLTDDQGWRVEIKKYPRLTEIGAWREETLVGHDSTGTHGDGVRHGGFYSQKEIRDIVAFAATRHITIVPEIEMPGHAQAAIAAYPELGCTGQPVKVRTRWGISKEVYNPSPATIGFLQDILVEVMALFPSPFIHIGGDEALKDHWISNADVQTQKRELGLADEHELQSWFIRQMDDFLTRHGRRLIGWDEILEGGLAPGAAVMSWRGMEGGIVAANAGHDVVMTPQSHTYLDHYQTADQAGEPLAIGGFLPLEKVYRFDPIPPELAEDKRAHILGLQAQLWAEYMPTGEQVEYMAFPRLCALAEVAWSAPSARDFGDFRARLDLHLHRLDAAQIGYRRLDD